MAEVMTARSEVGGKVIDLTQVSRHQIKDDNDSEVDEDEMRDNVDLDDQPNLTVGYRVGIDCVRGILVDEGTQVRVDLVRGKSKA